MAYRDMSYTAMSESQLIEKLNHYGALIAEYEEVRKMKKEIGEHHKVQDRAIERYNNAVNSVALQLVVSHFSSLANHGELRAAMRPIENWRFKMLIQIQWERFFDSYGQRSL